VGADERGGGREGGEFVGGEGEVNHPVDPISTQNTGEGKGNIFKAELIGENGRERNDFFTIPHNSLDNVGQGGGNTIVSGTFARNNFVGIFSSFSDCPSDMVG